MIILFLKIYFLPLFGMFHMVSVQFHECVATHLCSSSTLFVQWSVNIYILLFKRFSGAQIFILQHCLFRVEKSSGVERPNIGWPSWQNHSLGPHKLIIGLFLTLSGKWTLGHILSHWLLSFYIHLVSLSPELRQQKTVEKGPCLVSRGQYSTQPKIEVQ